MIGRVTHSVPEARSCSKPTRVLVLVCQEGEPSAFWCGATVRWKVRLRRGVNGAYAKCTVYRPFAVALCMDSLSRVGCLSGVCECRLLCSVGCHFFRVGQLCAMEAQWVSGLLLVLLALRALLRQR